MGNLIGSDNPFPSVLLVEGSTPANPASGDERLFVDSADHLLKWVDSSGTVRSASTGSVATDPIWTAKGGLAVGTGSSTAAELAAGTNGQVPTYASGETTGVKPAYPPGYEFAYNQVTSSVNCTATTYSTANTIIAGALITYDGSPVMIECFSPYAFPDTSGQTGYLVLYLDGSSIGLIAFSGTSTLPQALGGRSQWTPSAGAHTFSLRGYVTSGTFVVGAGVSGSGAAMPSFLRITKV